MKSYTGWLFDLYTDPKHGIVLWLLGEDGRPHSFTQQFRITFYVGGPFHRLRQLWKYLKDQPVSLARTQRKDLYAGMQDVLKVEAGSPSAFDELFKDISHRFPDLSYYDVDIPLDLRYAFAFGVFPLAHCKVEVEQGWEVTSIRALDTPWELDPKLPDLRILNIRPDVDPAHAAPTYLLVEFQKFKYRLSFDNPRELLLRLNAILRQYDPDVLLTSYGDTWLFTRLEEISGQTTIPFNPNRDLLKSVRRKK